MNRLKSEHVITAENQDDLLLAKMDAKLIVQVLINLVDNAIKYTPAGSHIHISTGKEGQWAIISIADDGAGIPDENKKQVFDMFYSGANRIADSRRLSDKTIFSGGTFGTASRDAKEAADDEK